MVLHHVNILSDVSLIKEYMPVRIKDTNTVRQAFETMTKIFTNTIGNLRVMAVLEIVFNSSV